MSTKRMIRELDRCAAWLLSQTEPVKSHQMAVLAMSGITDKESWARRMMKRMEETGRARVDDVDSAGGGYWWVHPDNDFRPDAEKIDEAASRIARATGVSEQSVREAIESAINYPGPLTGAELSAPRAYPSIHKVGRFLGETAMMRSMLVSDYAHTFDVAGFSRELGNWLAWKMFPAEPKKFFWDLGYWPPQSRA